MTEGQGESSIAPLFESGAINIGGSCEEQPSEAWYGSCDPSEPL